MIDEILDVYYAPIIIPDITREGLKAKLLELLESCKPRLVDAEMPNATTVAYNNAVREYHSNIRKLFEVENG